MQHHEFERLLARKLSGEATPSEERELQQYLQEQPGDQYFSELLSAYWHSGKDATFPDTTSADQHFAHILELAEQGSLVDMPVRRSRFSRITRISIAAAILVAFMIPAWLFFNNKQQPVKKNNSEVVASKGTRSRIVLPDGSHVWLNADSKLVYDAQFNDHTREVTLEGEAYFDVVRDTTRPFVVHTTGIAVRVLGTAFNVKSYPQESTIEATLIHGSIEVQNNREPKAPKVILRPHEKLVFTKPSTTADDQKTGTGSITTPEFAITSLPRNVPDTAFVETSWVYNRLLFDGDTFRELAPKMERWFNVKIDFVNEDVAAYRLHGVFENENIDEAMKALQLIAGFKYTIANGEVKIGR